VGSGRVIDICGRRVLYVPRKVRSKTREKKDPTFVGGYGGWAIPGGISRRGMPRDTPQGKRFLKIEGGDHGGSGKILRSNRRVATLAIRISGKKVGKGLGPNQPKGKAPSAVVERAGTF